MVLNRLNRIESGVDRGGPWVPPGATVSMEEADLLTCVTYSNTVLPACTTKQ